jgi:hypothetical protein
MVKDEMGRYRRGLQQSTSCGDSIAREYSILSKQYSVIEQRISICLVENEEGWTGEVFP